jgi:hypothetical protein
MTAASPRFLSLTELNLDVAEISRPMSLPHLNTRPRACDLTCTDGEPAVRRDTYDEDATLPICMKDLRTSTRPGRRDIADASHVPGGFTAEPQQNPSFAITGSIAASAPIAPTAGKKRRMWESSADYIRLA